MSKLTRETEIETKHQDKSLNFKIENFHMSIFLEVLSQNSFLLAY